MRVGLVGAGRLGTALACRLPARIGWIADIDRRRAEVLAREVSALAVSSDELFRDCRVILLAVPPAAVETLMVESGSRLAADAVVFDLATGVDTKRLRRRGLPPSGRLAGLKPIVQAYAFGHGAGAVFVLDPEDRDLRDVAAGIVEPAGSVVIGDTARVREINNAATRAALRLVYELQSEIRPLSMDPQWIAAALHTVAAGTIQDWPPGQPNDYLRDRLRELNLCCDWSAGTVEPAAGNGRP